MEPADELRYYRELTESLRQSLDDFNSLRDDAQKLFSARTAEDAATVFSQAAKRLLKVHEVEVYVHDPDRRVFQLVTDNVALMQPPPDVVEWIFKTNRSANVTVGKREVLIIPLSVKQMPVGAVCADMTGRTESITQTHLDLLTTLADQVAAMLASLLLVGKVEHQARLLNNILESITNGILALTKEGRISLFNRNAMAMLDLTSDVIGKRVEEVLPADLLGTVSEMFDETRRVGFSMERAVMHRLSSGMDLQIAVSTSLLRDEALRTEGVVLVFRDMTASKELERLRQLDKMKDEFVSNVSHELKTPLTSIKAYTEALEDMVQEPRQKEFLKVVEEESDRLLFLINDLLSVARIQSGHMRLKLAKVDPRSIVTDILHLAKCKSDNHAVTTEFAGVPECYLDKDMLKEVMVNLLSNAIKYSPNGGRVWIRLAEFEGNLRFEVEDQGIGIPAEHLPRIFDAFYRIDNSLTYEISGTGLGLAIVKAIVEAHGGKVSVESQIGKGSKFAVLIPIRKEIAAAEMGFEESLT